MENHIGNRLLVGGIPTPLKNMSSSVGVIIPYIMENKTCSKPPTSNCLPTIACSNPDFHYINSECWMVLSCKGFGSGFETWFIAEIVPRFLSNVGSAYFLLKYSLIVFAKLTVQHKRGNHEKLITVSHILANQFQIGMIKQIIINDVQRDALTNWRTVPWSLNPQVFMQRRAATLRWWDLIQLRSESKCKQMSKQMISIFHRLSFKWQILDTLVSAYLH